MVGTKLVWWDAGTIRRLRRLTVGILGLFVACYLAMLRMPGERYRGPLPALTDAQTALADSLRTDVEALAVTIGVRQVFDIGGLRAAENYLLARFGEAGYRVERQTWDCLGELVSNLIVTVAGTTEPDSIVVIGAHYDTADGTPGANDNASGVAGVVALAERFAASRPAKTLRFVAFVNEEPPFFSTPDQGSRVYAKACRAAGEQIDAMLCLECLGCYNDDADGQRYPLAPLRWAFGDRGDFVGFIGNVASRKLVHRSLGTFRREVPFPSEGLAAPPWVKGIGWSDHASFWKAGYPALMVTDTALFRYDHYHQASDLPEVMDFARMARVVDGLAPVIADLVGCEVPG